MSGLTQEQLKRIEENRKKALARRAASLAAAGKSSNNQPTKPSNFQPSSSSSSSAATQPYSRQTNPTVVPWKPGGQQNTNQKSGPPGQNSQAISNQTSVPGKSASNFYKPNQTTINNNTQYGKSNATGSSFKGTQEQKMPGNISKQTGDGKQLKICCFKL